MRWFMSNRRITGSAYESQASFWVSGAALFPFSTASVILILQWAELTGLCVPFCHTANYSSILVGLVTREQKGNILPRKNDSVLLILPGPLST